MLLFVICDSEATASGVARIWCEGGGHKTT